MQPAPLIIKAYTPGELAEMYGVTTKTLKTWVGMQGEKIGERKSKYFTSFQVKRIYDCIGIPEGYYKVED